MENLQHCPGRELAGFNTGPFAAAAAAAAAPAVSHPSSLLLHREQQQHSPHPGAAATMVSLPKRRSNSIRTFDWTRDSVRRAPTDFQKSVREYVDWHKSPLGPMAEWSATLRQFVLLSMADPSPSAVLYDVLGETAIVYNESFATLIGGKHPTLQGQPVRNRLSDLCVGFDEAWQRQAASGCAEVVKNQRVRQDRLGFVEEKTYTWKFAPIIGDDGLVAGSLVSVDEFRTPPRRERSKSAVREFGNAVKNAISHGSYQAAVTVKQLDDHFSRRSCNCDKLWQLHQDMENSERRYTKFADLAPVGIVALDSKTFEVEWANKAYFDVMAQPQDAKSFLHFVHPEDVAEVRGNLEMGAFQERAFTFECRLKRWAGRQAVSPSEAIPRATPAWVMVSAFRETEHEGHTMCWIIDITAHKNAEEFLRRRMDEAVEMRQQKERFIDMISHEIRNPLSAMMHCADDIVETARNSTLNSSGDVLDSAQTIAYCTKHIQNIVGDVLLLSKMDSKLIEIHPIATKPQETVQNALNIFSGEIRANSMELVFKEDPSLEELKIEYLLFDPSRMIQVLLNLVTNAIKVVKNRSERKIEVTLKATTRAPCEDTGAIVCVQPRQSPTPVEFGQPFDTEQSIYLQTLVKDTGPGLDAEEMASLFERFAQANPKTESKYGGLGLGLFISRDLTELQGGRIGVSTEPGTGSTFMFSIETKRASPPKVPVATAVPTRFQEASTTPSPTVVAPQVVIAPPPTSVAPAMSSLDTMSPSEPLRGHGIARRQTLEKSDQRKILVVEDNLINQKILANLLRKRGYDVSVALHGEEALRTLLMASANSDPLGELPFDCVLMDIEMPVMNGLKCTEIIRAYEAKKENPTHLPIIAVTANARSEHGTAALEAGMDAITTKPYKIEDLIIQIEHVIKDDNAG